MLQNHLNQTRRDDGETIAIQALSFLSGRPEELGRFMALSGIGPHSLRDAARDPGFLSGVLDFMLQEEQLLLVFSEETGIDPAHIARACTAISAESSRD